MASEMLIFAKSAHQTKLPVDSEEGNTEGWTEDMVKEWNTEGWTEDMVEEEWNTEGWTEDMHLPQACSQKT